ncbi:alpha-E domain-containing protein [Polynucleobacter rarus]|uniref:alpha-E domain-containing protein n=1 Tax=Polynucleobacter rarus TaxID=556055 RepID=UPI000D3E5BD3|nr:alpha-E domain-containing protein [Polynucleobacter rarus]
MLSRTADCLYWMSRYNERAENTARMLDVAYQTSLMPHPNSTMEETWRKILNVSLLENLFESKYSEYTRENVLQFMISDLDNPSSILTCLNSARVNARIIRGKIPSEVWETQNLTYLNVQKFLPNTPEDDPSAFFEWVKYRCHLFHGVVIGTMLVNESFKFLEIGTYLERADNTARILKAKYQVHRAGQQQSSQMNVGSMSQSQSSTTRPSPIQSNEIFDFYHWVSLLRSVSAFEIYRQTYADQITPERIVDLLVFNPLLPRSLTKCINTLLSLLGDLKAHQSRDIEHLVSKLKSELDYSDVDDVFAEGLDNFIQRFLEKINHIADEFSNSYLIPLSVS